MINSDALDRVERRSAALLSRHSPTILRLSMGIIFLGFGVLKFFPGVSPAEDLAVSTFERLTFGLVPERVALLVVATLESTIGVLLLTGRLLRVALALLAVQMVGILSPLVLLGSQLFAGPYGAPTLEGQYVIKDLVLLAAALVVAGDVLRDRPDGAT